MYKLILGTPGRRAAANTVCSGGMTVLTGITVNLLTANGDFQPKLAIYTPSFWFLFVLTCFWIVLQRAQYKKDRETMRFSDKSFCSAYIREYHLSAHAAQLQSDPSKLNLKTLKALCDGLGIDMEENK